MKSKFSFAELKDRGFIVKPCVIGGVNCGLVVPTMAVNPDLWNKDTLVYRSSIWTEDGELVSGSLPKFFNLTEACAIVADPTDDDFQDSTVVSKRDGSTLILSSFNGELIHRTRGTVNAESLPNGNEIALLKKKYPKAFDNAYLNGGEFSLIFEWTTPSNRIIIDYGSEPELSLIAIIDHQDYSLLGQPLLDYIATSMINVPRPKTYRYSSMKDMINSVSKFKNEEGVVVYYNKGQDIKKVKGDEYLTLHRLKANATLKNVIEMFFENRFNTYSEFEGYIKKTFDFECFKMVEQHSKTVWKYFVESLEIIGQLRVEVAPLIGLPRKDAALQIMAKHKEDGYSSFCFVLLDGKDVPDKMIKGLIVRLMEDNSEFKEETVNDDEQ